jgi:hypothetical protein
MQFLKCKPEKIEETLSKARDLFAGGSILIDKIQMSELSWTAIFGDGRLKDRDNISGVSVEITKDAGRDAVIVLGTNAQAKNIKKNAKK